MEIRREHAETVVELLGRGLVCGLGEPEPGEMCLEALKCYVLGLPHGDDPQCEIAAGRDLQIRLNDAVWSSPTARARGMARIGIAMLGSRGVLDEAEFVRRVVDMTIRRAVPVGLRAAAGRNPKHAKALEAAAVRCEQDGTREACEHARTVARAYAARSSAAAATYDAAYDAAYAASAAADAAYFAAAASASASAADVADAAAAYAAADVADAAADASAADARTRDRVLADYAEWVVQILIDMQAPGCQWLDLVPVAS